MTLPEGLDPAAIIGGSRLALARALTVVENDRAGAAQLLARLGSHCGRAQVVGITGAPGAGKSTLINALLGEWLRRGRRVAVLAVDPSSPVTGGALLGDRVRMGEHGADERVFIRSLSSRGHLGGLSRTTAQLVDVFDAAGFDMVIVETVGVGQSEVAVGSVADTSLVVCPPGLGDDVQAIKAGILEIADRLVLNKADSPLADRAALDLESACGARVTGGWEVRVMRTVATSGAGVVDLADRIDAHARVAGLGRRRHRGAPTVTLAAPSAAPSAAASAARSAAPSVAPSGMSPEAQSAPTPEDPSVMTPEAPSITTPAAAPAVTDDELFSQIRAWRAQGRGVALATVVRTWGSSPRPEGSHLAVEQGCAFVGSVSGGCIEAAVIGEAIEVIADGRPRMLEFGVSDEQAWEVGLACGGRVQVFLERIG